MALAAWRLTMCGGARAMCHRSPTATTLIASQRHCCGLITLAIPSPHMQHVVARLFYPSKPVSGLLSVPLTWIRDWQYAYGRCHPQLPIAMHS